VDETTHIFTAVTRSDWEPIHTFALPHRSEPRSQGEAAQLPESATWEVVHVHSSRALGFAQVVWLVQATRHRTCLANGLHNLSAHTIRRNGDATQAKRSAEGGRVLKQ